MRYNKAHGGTLRLLMDEAVPRRPDGALALCQVCQRRAWYRGGYINILVRGLERLAEAHAYLNSVFLANIKRLEIGQACGAVTPYQERAIAMAKEIADEKSWAIRISRRGAEYVLITRISHPPAATTASSPALIVDRAGMGSGE